jgi:hypothetical protein
MESVGEGPSEMADRCPRCGRKFLRRKVVPVPSQDQIPLALRGLRLYREDGNLISKWPELVEAWRVAFPGVNVLEEVQRAHAWEVSNAAKRKVFRARFLHNWLARVQDGRGCARERGREERPAPMTTRQELLLQLAQFKDGQVVFHGDLWTVRREGLYREEAGVRPWRSVSEGEMRSIIGKLKGTHA